MTFTEHIINISKKNRIDNIAILRQEIDKPWVQEKIESYLNRFGDIFTKEEIISQIMSNDIVASFFAKDPAKQNLSEKECAKWIGVEKLPAFGKNCIRFDSEGNIISKKEVGASKSADFLVEGIYFTQKYTGENTGGAQDNQYEDVVTFLKNGSKKQKVGAIIDGAYWKDFGNRKKLAMAFADNSNVIILSADEIRGGRQLGKTDLQKTQHYTTEAEDICQELPKYIPQGANLVEPFVGKGDLLRLFPNSQWETYDVDETTGANHIQDTLLDTPNYIGKWVITNPPFLAKNKATDKRYFLDSKYNDLYKIALSSIIGCEGGIIIVPLNFLTDEDSQDIRIDFLSAYCIDRVNVFTVPVFKTTSYSVCAFAFHKEKNKQQDIKIRIFPENTNFSYVATQETGYRMAGNFFDKIDKEKPIFGRLTATTTDNITKMKLYALDTRTEKIRLTYGEEPYMGKISDRTYLTFTTKRNFTDEQQKQLVEEFNVRLNAEREKYHNLILTNYRDWNRKRISFTFAYKFLSMIVRELDF